MLAFACGYPVASAQFVEKIILAPLSFLGTLAKKHKFLDSSIFIPLREILWNIGW